MFKFQLQIKVKNEKVITLGIPLWRRIAFLFFALALLAGLFTVGLQATRVWIPALLFLFCLLAAFYEESWVFDNASRRITERHGLLFFFKQTHWDYDSIATLDVYTFRRGAAKTRSREQEGRRRREVTILALVHKGGEHFDIEILSGASAVTELQNTGEKLRAFTGLPLKVGRA